MKNVVQEKVSFVGNADLVTIIPILNRFLSRNIKYTKFRDRKND